MNSILYQKFLKEKVERDCQFCLKTFSNKKVKQMHWATCLALKFLIQTSSPRVTSEIVKIRKESLERKIRTQVVNEKNVKNLS